MSTNSRPFDLLVCHEFCLLKSLKILNRHMILIIFWFWKVVSEILREVKNIFIYIYTSREKCSPSPCFPKPLKWSHRYRLIWFILFKTCILNFMSSQAYLLSSTYFAQMYFNALFFSIFVKNLSPKCSLYLLMNNCFYSKLFSKM